jgi:hypothetical protein
MSRTRGVFAGALLFSVVVGGLAASLSARADAAPPGVTGPTESFTATVVEGTIVPAGPAVRFNAERPSKTNPAQLEQLTVETAQASLAIPGEILSMTGNYDTDLKIFRTSSMVSLGNANPVRTSVAVPANENDNADDDDNNADDDDDDNGNDNN